MDMAFSIDPLKVSAPCLLAMHASSKGMLYRAICANIPKVSSTESSTEPTPSIIGGTREEKSLGRHEDCGL